MPAPEVGPPCRARENADRRALGQPFSPNLGLALGVPQLAQVDLRWRELRRLRRPRGATRAYEQNGRKSDRNEQSASHRGSLVGALAGVKEAPGPQLGAARLPSAADGGAG